MQPTQPAAHWARWAGPPDMSYSFKHRFMWPAGPEAAATAAGEAAGAAAGAGAGAARMAAAGGMPPNVAAYHYHGYNPYGRGFRPRFGFFRRFIWFGLGIGAASWWFHHKERERERERYLNATGGVVPSGQSGDGWGWRNHHHHNNFYRPLPLPAETSSLATEKSLPVDHHIPAYVSAAADEAPATAAAPAGAGSPPSPVVNESRRGWGRWRDRRMEEERLRMAGSNADVPAQQTQAAQASSSTAQTANVQEREPTKASVSISIDKDEEYRKLKEVVEKLWAAKTSGVADVQKDANERAKDYAREKLDKLSLALDSLRESLRKDTTSSSDRKLV